MSDASHHHAHAPAVIIVPVLVPVEVPAAGSPKVVKSVKPGPHQHAPREAWRPATGIPGRRGKAEALRKFLDRWAKQDADIRAFMRPDLWAMQSWLARGGVPA